MAKNITFIPARANNSSLAENMKINKLRVAAYCRVSTSQEEQLSSYDAQVRYYTDYINNKKEYVLAGIYADEGISGTNTKKRDDFNRMIADCQAGNIDRIITKSISRFARNTLDCLNYVRMLKELKIGITFEKENIDTLDSKGEVLLTILSSLAQDESRSLSENSTWGIRRKFEQGQVRINHTKFMGYEKNDKGELIINEAQAKTVIRIYNEYLNGKCETTIAKELEKDRIPKWDGSFHWYSSTIIRMLGNEKYKGDALLQKTYTVDFLTKKRADNKGDIPQYYVHDSHPAIISKDLWEAVQLERKRRRDYCERHHIKRLDCSNHLNPLEGRVICGKCGHAFGRKTWNSTDYRLKRVVWQCLSKYEVKGKIGCLARHIDEAPLYEAIIKALNSIIENKQEYMKKWEHQSKSENPLISETAKRFILIFKDAPLYEKVGPGLIFKTIEKITIYDKGLIDVVLLDGTKLE